MRRIAEKPAWRARVPWVVKLRPDLKPKVVASPRGSGTMLVPTPQRLAIRFGADETCPPAMGILLHIVAGAAEEQLAAGKRPVAPYWRVVDDKGTLNPRTPSGSNRQVAHLRREGHVVRRMTESGRLQVIGHESAMVRMRPNNTLRRPVSRVTALAEKRKGRATRPRC